jgi:thiol-disulfide isomerase/thioredoxin
MDKNTMNKNVLTGKRKLTKVILNITLALISIGIIIFDRFCSGTCSYISGDLFGLDLRYFGLAFMAFIIILSLVKADRLLITTLSAGVGVEIYLLGFQTWFNTFCPYCLAFGGMLLLLFLVNIRKTIIKEALLSASVGLVLFAFFFNGSVTPAFADESMVPAFGNGKIHVRLYSDYFCPSCRDLEPEIQTVLSDLVKKNVITLIFVDTPLSKNSPLYARYFLYMMNAKKTMDQALLARSLLYGAAAENRTEPEKLIEIMKKKQVPYKPFEVKPIFEILNSFIKEDRIRSTPTCVILQEGKTNHYKGKTEITKALERLNP